MIQFEVKTETKDIELFMDTLKHGAEPNIFYQQAHSDAAQKNKDHEGQESELDSEYEETNRNTDPSHYNAQNIP